MSGECDKCGEHAVECKCKKERKTFQNLPGEENPQFLEDGIEIYKLITKKYPNGSVEDRDNIMNSLCVSLLIFAGNNVKKDCFKEFLQLIHNILSKNLDKL